MKLYRSKSEIGLALLIAALVATAFTVWPRARPAAYYFEVTMRASLAGNAQLYYDTGSGMNEADSVRLPVEGGDREVDYKFPLPDGTYSLLRFDPTDRPGNVMVLSQLRIVTRTGQLVRAIAPMQVKAAQQIERLEPGPASVSLTTASTAADPILTVDWGEPLVLKELRARFLAHVRPPFLAFVFPRLIAWSVTFASFPAPERPTPPFFAGARSCGPGRPIIRSKQCSLVAALFVILSCYPVVFFRQELCLTQQP